RNFNTSSCAGYINCNKSNDQGKSGNNLKIEQRFPSHSTYLLQIRMAGNTDHKSGKQERGYDSLNQSKENLAQKAEILGEFPKIETNFHAYNHRHKNPGG